MVVGEVKFLGDAVVEAHPLPHALAREGERLPAGIIFRTEKITQERALYGDRNPVRDRLGRAERIEKVRELLSAA